MIYENGVYLELTAEEIAERKATERSRPPDCGGGDCSAHQAADQHASRGR